MLRRQNLSHLIRHFTDSGQHGVILPGIVGCGKTSLIEALCEELRQRKFEIVRYEGDDSKFRTLIRESSRLILDDLRSLGYVRPFIYVDEIQKEPLVFDAVKLAYDKTQALFIVSGSNPAFLRTMANDRLQRRAIVMPQFPFSLREIMTHEGLIDGDDPEVFQDLLVNKQTIAAYKIAQHKVHPRMNEIINRYLVIGGLPQAWLAPDEKTAMTAIRLVAERGITETYQTTIAVDDEVRLFLAARNSQEFTYRSLQQTLRTGKRQTADRVIDHLLNHGYIFKKTPFLGSYAASHKTYHTVYSWVDPGLVSYYAGTKPTEQDRGFRLEGMVHTRLAEYLARLPVKGTIYYYKPFHIKPSNRALSFGSGEIDFVIQVGKELTPIEVKKTNHLREIDTTLLQSFIGEHRLPFGIVIYGGAPFLDRERKIIFYPYWLL